LGKSITKTPATGTADFNFDASAPYAATVLEVTPFPTDSNATIVVNGQPTARGAIATIPFTGQTITVTTIVTAEDGISTKTYFVKVSRNGSNVATLASLSLGKSITKTHSTGTADFNFDASAPYTATVLEVTPIPTDPNATIVVNGQPTASGATATIPFSGQNLTVTTIVTAEDGISTKTYIVKVSRNGSNVATLSSLSLGKSITKTPASGTADFNFDASAPYTATVLEVTPIPTDPNATIVVNGQPTASGAIATIPFTGQTLTVTTVVTAEDGTSTKTYIVKVSRNGSNVATLASLSLGKSITKTPASGTADFNFDASAHYTATVVEVKPTPTDPNATIVVNGQPTLSGAIATVPFTGQSLTITTVVTAEDGTTTRTYTVKVSRKDPINNRIAAIVPTSSALNTDVTEVIVRQALSPNGDGNNDVLTIDGITSFPDNTLRIMNRAGSTVFETKGYNNSTKVFDGRSNNGTMQTAGTYFYTLEYKDNQKTKRKTGFIVIKY